MNTQIMNRHSLIATVLTTVTIGLFLWHSPVLGDQLDNEGTSPKLLAATAMATPGVPVSVMPRARAPQAEDVVASELGQRDLKVRRSDAVRWETEWTRSEAQRNTANTDAYADRKSRVAPPLPLDPHFAGILEAAGNTTGSISLNSADSSTGNTSPAVDRHLAGILEAAGSSQSVATPIFAASTTETHSLPVDRHFAGILASAGSLQGTSPANSRESVTAGATLAMDSHFAGILAAAG